MYAQKLGTNRYSDAYLTELRPYLELRSSESKIMTQSQVGGIEGEGAEAFKRGL